MKAWSKFHKSVRRGWKRSRIYRRVTMMQPDLFHRRNALMIIRLTRPGHWRRCPEGKGALAEIVEMFA
jgi:hypothetical protein